MEPDDLLCSRNARPRKTGAKILGLSRKALWEKCKRYGIPSARGESGDEEE